MSDKERGFYTKYAVKRLNDPTGKHRECEYYVLDLVHDRHAAPAMLAYSDSCEAEFPALANDLRDRAASVPKAAPRLALPSDIIALAVRAALGAKAGNVTLDGDLSAKDWEAMYLAQCEATDETAKRFQHIKEAKADATLKARIAELERDLAAVNRRLTDANGAPVLAMRNAALAAKAALDDCTHFDCIADRERTGYSCCAGGHLARTVVKAILGTDRLETIDG